MTSTENVIAGINYVCDRVKKTIGPAGKNVILKLKDTPAKVTNDGVSIAKAIILEDPEQNAGAELVKQVAVETNRTAGDGTTTSLVMAQKIMERGRELGVNIDIMKELQSKGEEIIKELDSMAIKIDSPEKLKQVATISVEDEATGELIADIFSKIGKDGDVDIDVSQTKRTYFEMAEGFSVDSGYLSTLMANDGSKSIFRDVPVLVTDHRIDTVEQILPLIKLLSSQKINNLAIFCAGMSDGVAVTLLQNQQRGAFNTLVIELPRMFTSEIGADISAVTDGTFIARASGIKIQDITLEHLGFAEKIVSDVLVTKIIAQSTEKTKAHLEYLASIDQTEEVRKRIAKINGGVAMLYIGASTVAELNYKKDKIEDAINATRCALEEGVIPGGGVALYHIANSLPKGDVTNAILWSALTAPFFQILANASTNISKIAEIKLGDGLDIKTGDIINMVDKGILDPVKVTKTALRNAISLASSVLTAEDVVIEK